MTEPLAPGAHVSERWSQWRRSISLDEYDVRWDHMQQRGEASHGEADFIESMGPRSVLDAGCGMGRVAIELDRRGIDVVGIDLDDDLLTFARKRGPNVRWEHADLATMQFDRRFDMVAMPGNVMIFCRVADRRRIIHTATQHLLPAGSIVAGFSLEPGRLALTLEEYDELCADCDLELVGHYATWEGEPFATGGNYVVAVHRRSRRFTVHDLLYEERGRIHRLTVSELATMRTSPTPPLIVDTRTHTDRQRFGVIEGSVHIPRTVLEWHLDPANGYHHPAATGLHQTLVIVCNTGYSSSIGAASLTRLGFSDVYDLVGGMAAWKAAGMHVVPPTHSYLDY